MSQQDLAAMKSLTKTLKASKRIDTLEAKKKKLEDKINKLNMEFMKKMMDGNTLGMNSASAKIDKAKNDLVKVLQELKSLDALRGGRRRTRRSTKRN